MTVFRLNQQDSIHWREDYLTGAQSVLSGLKNCDTWEIMGHRLKTVKANPFFSYSVLARLELKFIGN